MKSHKLLLLWVWRSNRGGESGGGRTGEEKKEKGGRAILCFNTSEPESPLSHRCPVHPLFTQTWTSTRTAARVRARRNTNTSPGTHTHTQPPHPSTPTPTPSSFEHVTVHHPHSEDTSTTLLQCAGHFTEQLVERSAASPEGLNSAPSST